jgi:hypothetical protein
MCSLFRQVQIFCQGIINANCQAGSERQEKIKDDSQANWKQAQTP